MASITLNDVPTEIFKQLEYEAAANYRSIEQEVLRRVERTLQIDAALRPGREKPWAGDPAAKPETAPLPKEKMDAIREKILKGQK